MTETVDLMTFLADPMGTIASARTQGSVLRTPEGALMVLDQVDVRTLLGDPALEVNFSQMLALTGITTGAFHDWMARSPLDHEGEDHRRWRTFMNRAFTPGRVKEVRPFLAAEADRLAVGLAEAGEVELMADFADVLPALGLCELIGVPAEDRDHFSALAHTIGYGFRPLLLAEHIAEVDDAVEQLLAYAAGLLDQRRSDPQGDLVSHFALAGDEAGYTNDDCAAFLAGLVFAGNDTTRNQIGWMVAVLIDRPDVWDGLGSGDVDAAEAVEELMRHRSAVPAVSRAVAADVEVDGEVIPAGTPVLLSLWGADSDPAVYPEPAEVDLVANAGLPHLAFGHGAHHCLGAALARAELQESLRALTATLAVPEVREPIEWSVPIGINGPTRLPLRVRPR